MILTRDTLLKVSLYESFTMKTILTVAALLVAVVVFVPDWINPEELGPVDGSITRECIGCI